MNPSLLYDDNAKHNNRQYWPDDHKYPDVDLFVGDIKHPRPINQVIYTPIENVIHRFISPWKGFLSCQLKSYKERTFIISLRLSDLQQDLTFHRFSSKLNHYLTMKDGTNDGQ